MQTTRLLALLAPALLASCGVASKKDAAPQGPPIRIGWQGPLSGPLEFIGTPNLRAVKLAIEAANENGGIAGRHIELLVRDDQKETRLTIATYHELKSQVDVILSPSYNGLLAVAADADALDKVVVNSLDSSDELGRAGDALFGVGLYNEGVGTTLANYTYRKLGQKSAAVIYRTDEPFINIVRGSFVRRYKELGGTVVATTPYTTRDLDSKDLDSLFAVLAGKRVEALVVLGFDETGALLAKAAATGHPFTFLGTDTWTSPGFLAAAGKAAEGALLTNLLPDDSIYTAWATRYRRAYDAAPDLFAMAGNDAAVTVLAALQRSASSRSSLREALLSINQLSDAGPGLNVVNCSRERAARGGCQPLTMSKDGVVRTFREEMYRLRGGTLERVGFVE